MMFCVRGCLLQRNEVTEYSWAEFLNESRAINLRLTTNTVRRGRKYIKGRFATLIIWIWESCAPTQPPLSTAQIHYQQLEEMRSTRLFLALTYGSVKNSFVIHYTSSDKVPNHVLEMNSPVLLATIFQHHKT